MGCITRTIRIDLKTGERTIIKEEPSDREDHSEELLLKYFAKIIMEEFKKEQKERRIS